MHACMHACIYIYIYTRTHAQPGQTPLENSCFCNWSPLSCAALLSSERTRVPKGPMSAMSQPGVGRATWESQYPNRKHLPETGTAIPERPWSSPVLKPLSLLFTSPLSLLMLMVSPMSSLQGCRELCSSLGILCLDPGSSGPHQARADTKYRNRQELAAGSYHTHFWVTRSWAQDSISKKLGTL